VESDSHELEVTRELDGARQDIWDLWTKPAGLARWWWPERFNTTYRIALSAGGSFRFTTIDVPPMGVLDLAGTFLDVEAPSRLRYSWRWESDLGHESTVTVDFQEVDADRTKVHVRHVGFRDAGDRDNHAIGWNDCIDRLEALLGT
jgi:uncharacterized protein YndB with AHSA1/START domain